MGPNQMFTKRLMPYAFIISLTVVCDDNNDAFYTNHKNRREFHIH